MRFVATDAHRHARVIALAFVVLGQPATNAFRTRQRARAIAVGHHDGEFFQVSFIIIGHRHDRFVLVMNDGDLRGLVEELRVRLGHVEAG